MKTMTPFARRRTSRPPPAIRHTIAASLREGSHLPIEHFWAKAQMMSRLLSFMLLFGLFVGMMGGTIVHAAEISGAHDVSTATQWLHTDSDHDQVPADSDKDYPHHHTVCHGHDLAAPTKTCGMPAVRDVTGLFWPRGDTLPVSGPLLSPLRPPIS